MLLQLRVPGRFLGHVFVLDFALFTLAITLSAWISGIFLDDTSLYPRQLSFLLANCLAFYENFVISSRWTRMKVLYLRCSTKMR